MKTPSPRPMVAILASLPLETEFIRQSWGPWKISNYAEFHLYRKRLPGIDIELMHSGVGKANTAAAATLLALHHPQTIFMIGCGGALPGSTLQVGDLALADCEIFGDEGVLAPEGFLNLKEMNLPLLSSSSLPLYNSVPVDPDWLRRAENKLSPFAAAAGVSLCTGPFVTVSTCSGTKKGGELLSRRTNGICENMEGAGAALVCARNHIPFCEIRGISNLVEDRDLSRWDLKKGAQIAQQALMVLLMADSEQVPA